METYFLISQLNDFVFCPLSIYFHQLYGGLNTRLFQDSPQINGKAAHAAVDEKRYSTHRDILQAVDVYSEKLGICGKIDTFDIGKGLLTERKKKITTIYDGYVFQLYGQYYCLTEMGYRVRALRFYASDSNKVFPVKLPDDDPPMRDRFFAFLDSVRHLSFSEYVPTNSQKCRHCIYNQLCDRALEC